MKKLRILAGLLLIAGLLALSPAPVEARCTFDCSDGGDWDGQFCWILSYGNCISCNYTCPAK